jgi:hypothetical protein
MGRFDADQVDFLLWALSGRSKAVVDALVADNPEFRKAVLGVVNADFPKGRRSTAGIPNPEYYRWQRNNKKLAEELGWLSA